MVLIGSIVWVIHKTEFWAGFWGLKDDEIAVIEIERGENGQPNVTVKDPSKSFWDVLELLGVPLVLAGLGAWFQKTQQDQSDRILKEQREQDGNEAREETLQLYFDRISTLLIDKNLMAIAAKKRNVIRKKKEILVISDSTEQEYLLEVAIDVIQARTLSILRRFEQDSERRSSVILFLVEADIVARFGISFSGVNLSGANLSRADLSGADMSGTNLSRVNLRGACLSGVNLSGANLHGANLILANLSDADLSDADLSLADLSCANLHGANLHGANLRANLILANLSGAYLHGADMSLAEGLTANQLETALLCLTHLPEGIDLRPNRDCEKLDTEEP